MGIFPERITPGHPQQNGRHERMHLTLKQQTATPPAATLRQQQKRFAAFRQEYNRERPHEALGQKPPAQFFEASPRPYPARLPELEYPADWQIRRVCAGGKFRCGGRQLAFLSHALVGERIGLQPIDDRYWRLWRLRVGCTGQSASQHLFAVAMATLACTTSPARSAHTGRSSLNVATGFIALSPG